jgi:hypothetical protein
MSRCFLLELLKDAIGVGNGVGRCRKDDLQWQR